MMDEGESLKEGLADGKLTGGTAWMDESEDDSLWSSDLNPEELQDGKLQMENLGDDVEDVHRASAETNDTTLQKHFQNMEVENRALKAQCDGIRSEMSYVLSESEKKTVKIAQLMNTQQALEQQLEEYKISLDQSSQDLQEKSLIIECLQSPIEVYIAAIEELSLKNKHLEGQLKMAMMFGGSHVDHQEEREQEQRLHGIQEQSPVSGKAHVQTKSWWRRKANGLRKVLRRMGTFCSCMRSNQVHPASDVMLPV